MGAFFEGVFFLAAGGGIIVGGFFRQLSPFSRLELQQDEVQCIAGLFLPLSCCTFQMLEMFRRLLPVRKNNNKKISI